MAERLTISSGEITFYSDTYNKCSNKNSNEVKSKVEKGIPYYAIKEYKYKQYNTDELSEMYSKLSKLEDIMEKYGIESVEELDKRLQNLFELTCGRKNGKTIARKIILFDKMKQDRDTWQKACELACDVILRFTDGCPCKADYFYQQAKTEGNDDNR